MRFTSFTRGLHRRVENQEARASLDERKQEDCMRGS